MTRINEADKTKKSIETQSVEKIDQLNKKNVENTKKYCMETIEIK